MHSLSTRIALLALVGTMSVVPAAFAAPNYSSSQQPGQNDANKSTTAIDCSLPANKYKPECKPQTYNRTRGPNVSTPGSNTTTTNSTTNTTTTNNSSSTNSSMFGNGYNGPRRGTFDFNQQDRSFFHQHFRGSNFGDFGFFLSPNFSISIGINVPHAYQRHLRPVPSSIYRYYPWFRGYLFFIDRRGDFVIVSPRNFRIVAVL
jgi:hypothetical protein